MTEDPGYLYGELDGAIYEAEGAGIDSADLVEWSRRLRATATRDRRYLWRIYDYMHLWDPDRELPGADFVDFMSGLMQEWKGDRQMIPKEHRGFDKEHYILDADYYDDEPDIDDSVPIELEYGIPGVNAPPDNHMHEDAHLEMEFEDRVSGDMGIE